MNKNLQNSTAHVSARRRLVRGAFAAPVALTLYNGSAFATTSLTCVAKQVASTNIADKYPSNSGAADTYLRVQLWTLAAGTPSNWVKGLDVTNLLKAGTSAYILSTEWQCFSPGSSQVKIGSSNITPVVGTKYPSQPSRNYGATVPQQLGAYVAVRVDTNGNIVGVVGVGAGNTGNSAVHQSCWSSFKPAP